MTSCRYPKCRREPEIIYYDKPLCDLHWSKIDCNPGFLRKKLGLPVRKFDLPIRYPRPKRGRK